MMEAMKAAGCQFIQTMGYITVSDTTFVVALMLVPGDSNSPYCETNLSDEVLGALIKAGVDGCQTGKCFADKEGLFDIGDYSWPQPGPYPGEADF